MMRNLKRLAAGACALALAAAAARPGTRSPRRRASRPLAGRKKRRPGRSQDRGLRKPVDGQDDARGEGRPDDPGRHRLDHARGPARLSARARSWPAAARRRWTRPTARPPRPGSPPRAPSARSRSSRQPGRTHIPLIFGIDAVHGNANVVGATIFPHNIGLGAMHDPALMTQIGAATAEETAAAGIDWAFGPTLAVPHDDRWGRTYEGYSEDPEIVASYAGAMVEGLQGAPGKGTHPAGPCRGQRQAFPRRRRHRSAASTRATPQISESELIRIHAPGYPPAIDAGAMTRDGQLLELERREDARQQEPADRRAEGPDGLRRLRRRRLERARPGAGLHQRRLPGRVQRRARHGDGARQLEGAVRQHRRRGRRRARSRWRASTMRCAASCASRSSSACSIRRGLMRGQGATCSASPAHRAIARQAVRESLVLLKNNGVLPLKAERAHAGRRRGADDIGQQTGGWTLSLAGRRQHQRRLPRRHQSIYAGIAAAVKAGGRHARRSAADGSFTDQARRRDRRVRREALCRDARRHPHARIPGRRQAGAGPAQEAQGGGHPDRRRCSCRAGRSG